jgi:hypothetical protein
MGRALVVGVPPFVVDLMCHRFEVEWVYASRVPTQVVDIKSKLRPIDGFV